MPELFIVPSDTEMTKDLLSELIQKHRSFNLSYSAYKQLYEGDHAILQQKQKSNTSLIIAWLLILQNTSLIHLTAILSVCQSKRATRINKSAII